MKKIYLAPRMETVSISLLGMLATSDPNVQYSPQQKVDKNVEALGNERKSSIWQDSKNTLW